MLDNVHDNHLNIVRMKVLGRSVTCLAARNGQIYSRKNVKLSLLPSTSEYASSSTDIFLRKSHIIMSKSAFRFCGANNGEDVFDGIWFLF